MKSLGLSLLVALGTLIAMAVVLPGFFTGGGIIFPSIVAWVATSVFALERRPRHVWLHVAAIGVMVAAFLSLYIFAIPKLFPPPASYIPGGGPNAYPPTEQLRPPQ